MRMVHGAFDEFDAGEVLPVSHGLLEQGLVSAGEIGVDLVRNDSVVPDAILTSRGSAPHSHSGGVSSAGGRVTVVVFPSALFAVHSSLISHVLLLRPGFSSIPSAGSTVLFFFALIWLWSYCFCYC